MTTGRGTRDIMSGWIRRIRSKSVIEALPTVKISGEKADSRLHDQTAVLVETNRKYHRAEFVENKPNSVSCFAFTKASRNAVQQPASSTLFRPIGPSNTIIQYPMIRADKQWYQCTLPLRTQWNRYRSRRYFSRQAAILAEAMTRSGVSTLIAASVGTL